VGPFVPVNCAAIPENLLEAEFFGAKKGSYTGAAADRTGYFEQANGGTLFLDEVGDLPLSMQSKLLRAIQERHVRALGANSEVPVDVRIVSATHRDLAAAVTEGRFRQDLFYRINVIELSIPSLRERKEDLPELCEALLARIVGRPVGEVRVSDASLAALSQYSLPGNVRELENILHRAWAMAESNELVLDLGALGSLPHGGQSFVGRPGHHADPSDSALPSDLTAFLDAQERVILLHALREHGFNRTAAAQQLGISLRQIRYRAARLGIEMPTGVNPREG
jgi:two-component system, NtrC family, response regulator PilR